MEARDGKEAFAAARRTAAYAAAMDAPDPPAPRGALVVSIVAALSGVALVGIGLGVDESVLLVVGGTVVVLALVFFVATARERAIAALPVHRELAEIVACTHEVRATNPFEGSRSTTARVHFVELRFEDGTAIRREVRDAALLRAIKRGTLGMPCLGIAACRGEELRGWRSVSVAGGQ